MNQQHQLNYLCFNIDTAPDVKSATLVDEVKPKKKNLLPDPISSFEDFKKEKFSEGYALIMKKNYKNQDTIDKHINELKEKNYKVEYTRYQEEYTHQIQMLAINPPFAMTKLITFKANDNDILFLKNEELTIEKEKSIIEEAYQLIIERVLGDKGIATKELVTFNGKHFDIQVLIERGGVSGTNIGYRWLERLTIRGDKYGHCDMMEHRSYMSSPVNKLSLNENLVLRFGKKFRKPDLDYANCTFDELLKYAEAGILGLEHWYKQHNGIIVPLPKLDIKPETEITEDDIPQ